MPDIAIIDTIVILRSVGRRGEGGKAAPPRSFGVLKCLRL